jgi:hypothetical protein
MQVTNVMTFYNLALAAFLLVESGRACGTKEVMFQSSESCFRVCYPSSWRIYTGAGSQERALDIINFNPEKKLSGVFLPDGGAEIVFAPLPRELFDIERWLATRTRGETKPAVEQIRMNPHGRGGITVYTRAEWTSEVGPSADAVMIKVAAHFGVGDLMFEAQLMYWKDDPASAQYTSDLARLLASFRIPAYSTCR